VNGEKVKVVIISKAGSEGLDFKCIRQIHILDPWYNMNRIEQIIGRGVRNFSHCMLEDFKERNVEIYLHATLPRDDEEPADLYVYRYAEKKAKLIGKVNRLLKEIAVDCLLNIGQHNFTIEQLNTLANNRNMKIWVSSLPEPIDFQIGDRDYSDICDYDICSSGVEGSNQFQCKPHAEITDGDVIQDTYNDDYANMNYSTIVKRIRQLFKKKLAYSRGQLIQEINIIKPYPEVQIDFALSRFIHNKNEIIYDEIGRAGYLVNRDDYYAFQPNEITDESASLFERGLPIDYKRTKLEIELQQPSETPKEVVEDHHDFVNKRHGELMAELQTNLASIEKARGVLLSKKVTKEVDWYTNLGYVYRILFERHRIENDTIIRMAVQHFIDYLPLQDRLALLSYYMNGQKADQTAELEFEGIIRNHFAEKLVNVRGYKGILLASEKEDADGGRKRTFIQDKEDKWIWSDALPTDETEIKRQSARMILVPLQNLHRIFGFLQVVKENIVFKILDTTNKTKIGSVCSGESKKDVLKRINMVSDLQYTNEDSEFTIDSTSIVKSGLCVLLEVLFRYYEEIQKNGKRWFLRLEQDPYM
jgi:hypothetical protein